MFMTNSMLLVWWTLDSTATTRH